MTKLERRANTQTLSKTQVNGIVTNQVWERRVEMFQWQKSHTSILRVVETSRQIVQTHS